MEESKKDFEVLYKFIETNKLKSRAYDVLKANVKTYTQKAGTFAENWRTLSNDEKMVLNEWYESNNGNLQKMKVQANQLREKLDKQKSGRPEIETVQQQESDDESKKSRMSKYGSETEEIDTRKKQTVEELKITVEKMSDSGRKIMQPEVKKLEDRLSQIEKQSSSSSSSQKTALIKCDKYFDDFHKDLQKKMEKMNQSDAELLNIYLNKDKQSTESEAVNIERRFSELMKSHPKTMNKFGNITASFDNTFQNIPSGIAIDPQWFRINKRREKIYDRVKTLEKQQMLTQTEHNKLLYKELTRNGGQSGADLAVVENQHGIEEYRVKYPSLDQMLNLKIVDQYAFDVAQKKHLTFVQTNLLTDILKSGGSIVMPNLEFLRQEYVQKQQLGQDYSEEFKKYQEAITKQVGQQVSYVGEQNWQFDGGKATKNLSAPALQKPLQKPNMIPVKDVMLGIEQMADYISKLSGNLNQIQLSKYKQVDDIFSSSVVQKKEPTTFKPQAGMAFKLRELMC